MWRKDAVDAAAWSARREVVEGRRARGRMERVDCDVVEGRECSGHAERERAAWWKDARVAAVRSAWREGRGGARSHRRDDTPDATTATLAMRA
jgi:hypothetical protein